MKVYVLTSGEYSDYRVRAVVATKELAEKIVSKRDGWRLPDEFLEMEVLTEEQDPPPSAWAVTMELDDDGLVSFSDEQEITRCPYEDYERWPRPKLDIWERTPSHETWRNYSGADRLDTMQHVFKVRVVCDDLELARKAAQDRIYQRIATIKGLT